MRALTTCHHPLRQAGNATPKSRRFFAPVFAFVISLCLLPEAGAQTTLTILPTQPGGGTLPEGWTSSNSGAALNQTNPARWLLESINPKDTITSAAYDLSGYTSVTISVDVARSGTGSTRNLLVEASVNDGATWSVGTITVGNSFANQTVTFTGTFTSTTRFRFSSEATTGRDIQVQNLGITGLFSSPDITLGGSLSAVGTTYGTATAAPSSFTASGLNITGGLTVTPPAGFEVSTSPTFASNVGTSASPLVLSGTGTIATTTVYVRLPATATVAGSPYSGDITVTSAGATTRIIPTAASTVSAKSLTITGATATNRAYDGTTAVAVGGGSLVGVVNGDAVTLGGSPSGTVTTATVGTGKAVTVSGYTLGGAGSGNYTLSQPTGLTVNITAAALPTTTFTPGTNGTFTASASGVTNWTYVYTGRSVDGLNATNNPYTFLAFSNSNAPTAPGFYTVTATPDANHTGTATEEYSIAGPLAKGIDVTKIAGSTTVRFNRSTLLGGLQRVDTNGILQTGTATNVVWTGVTAGSSQMPAGFQGSPTQANTVTFSASFVTLTPPGAGASTTDTFTLTVSDGVTGANFPVTVNSSAAPAFDLTVRKLLPIDGDPTCKKALFLTRPNRGVIVSFCTATNPVWTQVRDKTQLVQHGVQDGLVISNGPGQVVQRPAETINSGSSGVLELIVPADAEAMFFRANPVISTNAP